MKDKLLKIKSEALLAISSETADLEQIRIQYLGKKGELTAVLRGMGALTAEERPVIGQLANEVRAEIEGAIKEKAEAQKLMGEASILEMYLQVLPEVVKNAATPLSQTEKIVMYGDGNATKLVEDVMKTSNQITDGLVEATGIDIKSLLETALAPKKEKKKPKEE